MRSSSLSAVQCSRATPTTGTLQLVRLDHALQRRDDVLERQVSSDPEDDDRIALPALSAHAQPAASRPSWPPDGARATDDGVPAPSNAPQREKRSERPAVTASRRDAPPWSIPTTTIIRETSNPNAWIRCAPPGGNGSRSCQSTPGCPPRLRRRLPVNSHDGGKETMTERSSKPRGKHGARRNDGAPVANGAARGAAAAPAKLTAKRFDEQQSGAPAVVARGGRRFALTAPSGWRHADTLGFRTSSRGPIAYSLQEEQHADPR